MLSLDQQFYQWCHQLYVFAQNVIIVIIIIKHMHMPINARMWIAINSGIHIDAHKWFINGCWCVVIFYLPTCSDGYMTCAVSLDDISDNVIVCTGGSFVIASSIVHLWIAWNCLLSCKYDIPLNQHVCCFSNLKVCPLMSFDMRQYETNVANNTPLFFSVCSVWWALWTCFFDFLLLSLLVASYPTGLACYSVVSWLYVQWRCMT